MKALGIMNTLFLVLFDSKKGCWLNSRKENVSLLKPFDFQHVWPIFLVRKPSTKQLQMIFAKKVSSDTQLKKKIYFQLHDHRDMKGEKWNKTIATHRGIQTHQKASKLRSTQKGFNQPASSVPSAYKVAIAQATRSRI